MNYNIESFSTEALDYKELISKNDFDSLVTEIKKPEPVNSGINENPIFVKLGKVTNDKAILPDSPILYKQTGEIVQSEGFIRIPRSLRNSHEWQKLKLKQRHVFETILFNLRWSPQTHNISGKEFIVHPGQLCITIRQLVDLCNKTVYFKAEKVDLPFVQRSVSKFLELKWIDTRSDTGKTIFTILYPELYEYFNQKTIQDSILVSIQDRYTNKERKERKELKGTFDVVTNDVGSPLSYEDKKNNTNASEYTPSDSISDETAEEESPRISDEQFQEDFLIAYEFIKDKKIPVNPEEVERWIRQHGGFTIISNLHLMTTQKIPVRNPGGWMEKAIREDWAKLKKNEPINKQFAEEFKTKNNWSDLLILKKYCTIERTGYDLPFNFEPEAFKAVLTSKYENLFRGHVGFPNY